MAVAPWEGGLCGGQAIRQASYTAGELYGRRAIRQAGYAPDQAVHRDSRNMTARVPLPGRCRRDVDEG
ncbi:hypothetical protein Abr02nite_57200 [Paractinoplanes brasiliensis]|nr:hypothetical protein Abr02nite_57200 [Actinoplanes brasiliensis]